MNEEVSDELRVAVAVPGVYHAPALCSQLASRGLLDLAVVAHPLVPVRTRPHSPTAFRAAWAAMPYSSSLRRRVPGLKPSEERAFLDRFDVAAARHLSDRHAVVVAWSGAARRTLTRAKDVGSLAVVERGSAHILTQQSILEQEYDRIGAGSAQLPNSVTVENELAEYEIADRIMVPSEFARNSFVQHGVEASKIAVVPYGVDVAQFRPSGAPPGKFILAHAGSITIQKGVHLLLEAFDRANIPGSELRLYGRMTPEILPFMERYGHRVTHVGPVPHRQLSQALSECSALALASIQDGFGMVMAEALASGRPVVASTATAGPELIEDGVNGFTFESGDVEKLTSLLVEMESNAERLREMGNAARQSALAWDWDSYGEAVVHSYRASLAARPSGA